MFEFRERELEFGRESFRVFKIVRFYDVEEMLKIKKCK